MTNSTTNVASNQQLEPCRFCGGESLIEEFRDGDDPQPLFVATCKICPVKTYDQFTPEEAARIWNSRVSDGGVVATETPAYDGSMTPEQLEHANLIAESRGIDLETAQELVYLRDRVAAIPQSFEEAQLQKIYEDPHPGYDCRGTCVIHSGRFAATASPAAPKEEAVHHDPRWLWCGRCQAWIETEHLCGAQYIDRGNHYELVQPAVTRDGIAATTPSSHAAREAAARKYFCSCGGALTAEEYIEHYFEKGHDRGESQLLASGAAEDIMDYFARSERWTDKPIDGVIEIIQRRCFPSGGESRKD